MINNTQTGIYGQEKAIKFLCKKGMILLSSNFKAPSGEIDLIMKDGAYIAFVEVKYRRTLSFGLPRESINYRKQNRIKNTALHYVAYLQLQNQDFRFDTVELFETKEGLVVSHIENAFW